MHEGMAQYSFIRERIRGWRLRAAKVNVLRERWSSRASAVLVRIETQSASGEELSALMPSILDKAFKGEL
jgi:hypothetical protein